MMVDSIDDITKQARQGSVAAIIQVLNEKLADAGVRTRAVFADGMLQLLCEAATVEQLEKNTLVQRLRQVLEGIGPRNIQRVKINSRIVREQQLLWLEEINRDPENQLLWSEEIKLKQPHLLQRWTEDRKHQKRGSSVLRAPSPRQKKERQLLWRGIIGGTSLSLFVVLLAWVVQDTFEWTWGQPSSSATAPAEAAAPAQVTQNPPTSVSAQPDPFAQAVRLAEQAVADGKSAGSPAEWLEIAARWQRASDLMGQIEAQDQRYEVAQDRVARYRENREAALRAAEQQDVQ